MSQSSLALFIGGSKSMALDAVKRSAAASSDLILATRDDAA
jgi:hypothetical protein